MSYNGWTNYETWNVVLWFQNDETLYDILKKKIRIFERAGLLKSDIIFCVRSSFYEMFGHASTPDGVHLDNTEINWNEIRDCILEMWDLDTNEYAEQFYEEWENKDSFGREIF